MGLARFIAKLFSRFGSRSFLSTEDPEDPRHRLGREGERLAARYLARNGYKVLYRNFRAPHGGEVDLVCRDKARSELVFVEVKTRTGLAYGAPSEAVTREKQKLIANGALAWLRMLNRTDVTSRFDIVEVLMTDGAPQFNVIKDAFRLPGHYRW